MMTILVVKGDEGHVYSTTLLGPLFLNKSEVTIACISEHSRQNVNFHHLMHSEIDFLARQREGVLSREKNV